MAAHPHLTHWGRVRAAVVWAVLRRELDRRELDGRELDGGELDGRELDGGEFGRSGPLDIVDAGGGTGGFAVPLALLGHRVTVVDPSPDSLAALERRAAEEGTSGITGVQGDLATLVDLVGPGSADVVLCHSVLEVVDDPVAGIAAVAAVLRPGGLASVLAANRTAAVLSRAVAGRFAEATAALGDPAGRWGPGDTVLRRFGRDELLGLLAGAGLRAGPVHGIRVFTDLVAGGLLDADPSAFEELVALELAAADVAPYADIATQLHVLARR